MVILDSSNFIEILDNTPCTMKSRQERLRDFRIIASAIRESVKAGRTINHQIGRSIAKVYGKLKYYNLSADRYKGIGIVLLSMGYTISA